VALRDSDLRSTVLLDYKKSNSLIVQVSTYAKKYFRKNHLYSYLQFSEFALLLMSSKRERAELSRAISRSEPQGI
jgi:hypothetical protein